MGVWQRIAVLASVLLAAPLTPSAGELDPEAAWPLCGRITSDPPAGWHESQGCPAARFGNAAYSDAPYSSTFGPRPLFSGNNRYDFHRGMDLAAPLGTPIFAVSAGLVQIAGVDPGYTDPVIKLRHFRPGRTSCTAVGCYYTLYLHVQDWVVSPGTQVQKGQLIGHTGASSESDFAHLHFELRDAPASDPVSAWSRDAVHPLRLLPYAAPDAATIAFGNVDTSDPNATRAVITVSSERYDLDAVELRVFDAAHAEIAQPGAVPDALGYYVQPPFLDLELHNFQYSHKDSSGVPWSSFGAGGANQCPYHALHGPGYDAGVHLDAQDPADFHRGLFNGVRITTRKYWPSDVDDYWLQLEFLALRGPAACIEASASFASGASHSVEWGQCNVPPSAAFTHSCTNLQCGFDAAASADSDGTISAFQWTFGDGAMGTGLTVAHAYAQPGSYPVRLTVTDNEGATGTVQQTVVVQAPPTTITATVKTNSKRNQVSVSWTGATGAKVDIRRNGTLAIQTKNIGSWTDRNVTRGNRYVYRVCNAGSTTACSNDAAIDL